MFNNNFNIGNIIMLRKELETFPCLKDIPEYTQHADVVPYYLGPLLDEFVLSNEALIILEVFREKKKKKAYAYKCLHKKKIVYLVKMKDVEIDPNICFEILN
jgi:hypothetical protein